MDIDIDKFIEELEKNLKLYSTINQPYEIEKKNYNTLTITFYDGSIMTYVLGDKDVTFDLSKTLIDRIASENRFGKLNSYVSDLERTMEDAEEIRDQIDMTYSDIEMDEDY